MGKSGFVEKENNVIPVAFDVDFFYNRAVLYLERRDYTKALKYYWRTIDLEPNDPIHYCNIANILSEISLYKEANELLYYIIDKLDPKMSECYFFLGSNYLSLDDLEMGYTYIQRYLDISPNGEYKDDAEEILSFISVDIDNDNDFNLNNNGEKEKYILHNNAKNLLDKGKFYEAIYKLKRIVKEYPDFLVARNNLSLAYFYIEKYDKAIDQIKIVLDNDISNIHALCNLTIFYKHLENKKEYNNLLGILYKIYPYQKEQTYKLATTFAILEEHEMVFSHLSKLVDKGEVYDATFLHYCAIAAYNTKRYGYAKKCWEQILRNDSSSIITKYYLEVVLESANSKKHFKLPSFFYQYKLPIDELINLLHRNQNKYKNTLISKSLFWGLENCDENLKEYIIYSLVIFNNIEVERILRGFLLNDQEPYKLKKKALVALEEINAKPPYMVYTGGRTIKMDSLIPEIKLWKDNWVKVIKLIDKEFKGIYSVVELYDARILWYQYIRDIYPNAPQVRKVEGWVAAIEYIVNKMHHKSVSFKMLSEKYSVGTKTISRNVKELDGILKISKKPAEISIYPNR